MAAAILASRPSSAPRQGPPAVSAVAVAASSVDVCGLGRIASTEEQPFSDDTRFHAMLQSARERLLAGLRRQGEPAATAAAHLLAARAAADEARRDSARAVRATCGADASCAERVQQERASSPAEAAGRNDIEALVRMASASRDPFVHAIALEACSGPLTGPAGRRPATCSALDAPQWAALEPDNAVAWIRAAAAASAAGDAQGVDAALFRASRARTNRLYGDEIYGLVSRAIPADAGDAERAASHWLATELVEGWGLPPYRAVTQWCGQQSLRDPSRREQCGDLATQLAESGRTLMDLGIGIAVARRLDPASERAAAWTLRRDTLMQALRSVVDPVEPFGCASVKSHRAFLARAAESGEPAALRSLLVDPTTPVAAAAPASGR